MIAIKNWTQEYFLANQSECMQILEDSAIAEVPLLTNLCEIDDNALVRFRGMIQDILYPESYLKQYKLKNKNTDIRTICGMYRDVILMPHEEPIYSDSDEYSEKEVYFVTSIPGLNDWAKEGNLFEDHNFPIPIDRESCIVKIYNKIDLKPNQIIDVIGFIFLNPINLSSTNDTEISTHNPPLVPRLHTVKIIDLTKPTITNASIIISKAQNIRSDLHIIFTELLFGDTLVADYLICYLLSSIYGRTSDGLSLGRFSINVSNLPESKLNIFLKEFYNIIRLLVRKSHFLEVTANNLNRAPLVPKLDYEHNRLTNGELQLNNNTYLIINEPSLDINTLTTTGAENYKCLCNLILHQEIAYNCTYHPVKLKTDIPVLIFSDIKSRISNCAHIALHFVDVDIENIYDNTIEAVNHFLETKDRLKHFRETSLISFLYIIISWNAKQYLEISEWRIIVNWRIWHHKSFHFEFTIIGFADDDLIKMCRHCHMIRADHFITHIFLSIRLSPVNRQ